MISIAATKSALVATLALALSASALPYEARDVAAAAKTSAGCPGLAIGSLGFNTSAIQIYDGTPPKTPLAIEHGDQYEGRLVGSSSKAVEQQQFVFNNCSYSAGPYPGQKGNVASWQGYIQTLNKQGRFQCLTADKLGVKNAQVSLKDCLLDASKPGGVDATQHFQFQSISFDSYYNIVFLGAGDGKKTAQEFGGNTDYQFSLGNDAYPGYYNALNVSYAPSAQNKNPSLYERIGAQWVSISY